MAKKKSGRCGCMDKARKTKPAARKTVKKLPNKRKK